MLPKNLFTHGVSKKQKKNFCDIYLWHLYCIQLFHFVTIMFHFIILLAFVAVISTIGILAQTEKNAHKIPYLHLV